MLVPKYGTGCGAIFQVDSGLNGTRIAAPLWPSSTAASNHMTLAAAIGAKNRAPLGRIWVDGGAGRTRTRPPSDRPRPVRIGTNMGTHILVDVLIERPKPIKGHAPTLTTMHRIEVVLREAADAHEGPLSFAEIARRLPAAKVRPETVRVVAAEFRRLGLATWGSTGAFWTAVPDDVARVPREPLA